MLKFLKIIMKVLKPLIKLLAKLGFFTEENLSWIASQFDAE